MSNQLKCSFKKEFLEKSTILYVEDDVKIRTEAAEIFDGFFKNVIIAVDGQDGLEKFEAHQSEIDIILTDINMPNINGLELLAKIRQINWDIPILITTGFEQSDILIKLIKFNVTNYIVKPMQLNTTFKIISLLMEEKERKKEVKRQEDELKQFMSILDSINLVCEIDLDGNIIYANDLYLLTSGYNLDELSCITHPMIKNTQNDSLKYKDVQDTIKNKQAWNGDCEKIAKDGTVYHVFSIIIPIYHNNGNIKKYIEFATLTTKYKREILALKKQILSIKSKSFKNTLENKNKEVSYTVLTQKYQKHIDDSVNNEQQLLMELYESKKRNAYLENKLEEQEKRFEAFQSLHLDEIDKNSLENSML